MCIRDRQTLYSELFCSSRAAGLSHRRAAAPGTRDPKPYPVRTYQTHPEGLTSQWSGVERHQRSNWGTAAAHPCGGGAGTDTLRLPPCSACDLYPGLARDCIDHFLCTEILSAENACRPPHGGRYRPFRRPSIGSVKVTAPRPISCRERSAEKDPASVPLRRDRREKKHFGSVEEYL